MALKSSDLGFHTFLSGYYFIAIYPKDTEQERQQFAEELMQVNAWQNLMLERRISLSLLNEPITLNPVNDELYIHPLNHLRALTDLSNKKTLIQLSQSHSAVSGLNDLSLDGLCLTLKVIQRYRYVTQQRGYPSEVLQRMNDVNQNNLQDIQYWLDDLPVLEQYLKSNENEQFQSQCLNV